MSKLIEQKTHVVDIEDIMKYFIKGFQPPPGHTIVVTPQWFYDSHKGKVVFEFYTRPNE